MDGRRTVPKASVYEYARDGRLPCVCIGRHRKFVRRDLADAVSRMRSGELATGVSDCSAKAAEMRAASLACG